MSGLIIGSDPEVFLKDKSGKLVSAIGKIPGNKLLPHPTEHGNIQHDNILAEFNSIPSRSLVEFISNHHLILDDLKDILAPMELDIDISASKLVEDPFILMHPLARLAGCEPDYNAWDNSVNTPANYSENNLRGAGGHLHISFDFATDDEVRREFVKALDYVIGTASILLDSDTSRRQVYGKAGAHRPKYKSEGHPYDGVEYRVLSNFWLRDDSLMAFVYNGVKEVYDNFDYYVRLANIYKDSIISCINNSDTELASSFTTLKAA